MTGNIKESNDKAIRRVRSVAVAVVALNIGAIWAFESWRPAELTVDGLWNARVGLWSVLLLFDTWVAVGWYALLTHRTMIAVQEQAGTASDVHHLAVEQADSSRRPCVVIDRRVIETTGERASAGEAAGFYAHNIGPGFAVNVSHVTLPTPGHWENFKELGAVEAGGWMRLPEVLEQPLRDARKPYACALIAEAHDSRVRWTISVNVRDRNGEVSHAIIATDSEIGTAREFLDVQWPAVDARLRAILEEVNRRGN